MILFDLSGTLFAALHVDIADGQQPNKEYIRHLVLNSIRAYNKMFRDTYGEMVICCDSRSWRQQEFPLYKWVRKQERDDDNQDWQLIFSYMMEIKDDIAQHFPFPVLEVDNAEADDIMAVMAKNTSEPTIVVSNDKDMVALTKQPNVKQYRPYIKGIFTVDDPERYEFELILTGDKTDGIPNVHCDDDFLKIQYETKKLGEKPPRAPAISKAFKENCWGQYKLGGEMFLSNLIGVEKFKNFKRNQKLISLDHIPDDLRIKIESSWKHAKRGSPMSAMMYLTNHKMQLLAREIKDFETRQIARTLF